MKQFIAFIRERQWEHAKWNDYFIVENAKNPEQNFSEAVNEYLLTEAGMKQIEWTNEDFNWGDAMNDIPASI